MIIAPVNATLPGRRGEAVAQDGNVYGQRYRGTRARKERQMLTMTVPNEDKTCALAVLEQPASTTLTTLYDLVAAVQDSVGPEHDDLVVATVVSLLRAGHVTWGRARTAPPLLLRRLTRAS